MPFIDRVDAGGRLGQVLASWAGQDVVVLGLPRGGVPVAAEVARALGAPLDVVLVRKLGVPFQPELAMGAVGEGGVRILNDEVLRLGRITRSQLDEVEAREREELERRGGRYRRGRPRLSLAGRAPSSSTTASPPAQPPGRPVRPLDCSGPGVWCSPSRWHRSTRWPTFNESPTRSCAWRHRRICAR